MSDGPSDPPCRWNRPADCSRWRSTAPRSASPKAPRSWTPAVPSRLDTPTLCFADNLTPVNACRVCVVEVEGARTLVPACSRKAEDGMKVKTDTERVAAFAQAGDGDARLQRRDGPDQPRCPPVDGGLRGRIRNGSAPDDPSCPRASGMRANPVITTTPSTPRWPRASHQPIKIDNELYVRDYSRCILCYKCVEACGVDAQNTFAIAVAGRGFDARISTEYSVGLDESACVYCGNCIGVCPTGALMFTSEHEHARSRHLERGRTDRHEHDLSVLRGRVRARPACPGQRDREGDLARRTIP